ncbi:hypothetical protein ZHAS_00011640 [Anopheles sinensis]|uniref:Uncharacterized protein n=1 Tax=Anopheles sinensis TaxID=74873 RepID=A0A084W0Q5_ANOSI|nr:hypothetical protein ZHAS_00011640 [Anopheles sinensis]
MNESAKGLVPAAPVSGVVGGQGSVSGGGKNGASTMLTDGRGVATGSSTIVATRAADRRATSLSIGSYDSEGDELGSASGDRRDSSTDLNDSSSSSFGYNWGSTGDNISASVSRSSGLRFGIRGVNVNGMELRARLILDR